MTLKRKRPLDDDGALSISLGRLNILSIAVSFRELYVRSRTLNRWDLRAGEKGWRRV